LTIAKEIKSKHPHTRRGRSGSSIAIKFQSGCFTNIIGWMRRSDIAKLKAKLWMKTTYHLAIRGTSTGVNVCDLNHHTAALLSYRFRRKMKPVFGTTYSPPSLEALVMLSQPLPRKVSLVIQREGLPGRIPLVSFLQ